MIRFDKWLNKPMYDMPFEITHHPIFQHLIWFHDINTFLIDLLSKNHKGISFIYLHHFMVVAVFVNEK